MPDLHTSTDVNFEIPHSFFTNTAFIPRSSVLLLTCIRIHLHTNRKASFFFFLLQDFYFYCSYYSLWHLYTFTLVCRQVCCFLKSWMFVNRAQGGRMLWLPYFLFKAENAPHRYMLLFLRSNRHKWNNETRG